MVMSRYYKVFAGFLYLLLVVLAMTVSAVNAEAVGPSYRAPYVYAGSTYMQPSTTFWAYAPGGLSIARYPTRATAWVVTANTVQVSTGAVTSPGWDYVGIRYLSGYRVNPVTRWWYRRYGRWYIRIGYTDWLIRWGVLLPVYSTTNIWFYVYPSSRLATVSCMVSDYAISNWTAANQYALNFCKNHAPAGYIAQSGQVTGTYSYYVTSVKCNYNQMSVGVSSVAVTNTPNPNFLNICKTKAALPAGATLTGQTHTGTFGGALTCNYKKTTVQNHCAPSITKGMKPFLSYVIQNPTQNFSPPAGVKSVTYTANIMQKKVDGCAGLIPAGAAVAQNCVSLGKLTLPPTPPAGVANPMNWCADQKHVYKVSNANWSATLNQLASSSDKAIAGMPMGCSQKQTCTKMVSQPSLHLSIQSYSTRKVKKYSCHILTQRNQCKVLSRTRRMSNYTTWATEYSRLFILAGYARPIWQWRSLAALWMGCTATQVKPNTVKHTYVFNAGRWPVYRAYASTSVLSSSNTCQSFINVKAKLVSVSQPSTTTKYLRGSKGAVYMVAEDTTMQHKVYETVDKSKCALYFNNPKKYVHTSSNCLLHKKGPNGASFCADSVENFTDYSQPMSTVYFQ